MLKIVLDTNIFISAFIYHGMSKIILDLVLKNKIKPCVSSDLKKEVLAKLKEFDAEGQVVSDVKLFLDTSFAVVIPTEGMHQTVRPEVEGSCSSEVVE